MPFVNDISPSASQGEHHIRSGFKSFLWRALGVVILALITFAYTREWVLATLVTSIHHLTFLFVFYLHERAWLAVRRPSRLVLRSLAKMITYETLLGNLILGSITYLLTGSWRTMTAITLTYIGIKHIVYIFNEFLWDKIKWGKLVRRPSVAQS